jgi:hypothetical protein
MDEGQMRRRSDSTGDFRLCKPIVAFMNGQLDATSVQFSDRIALNAERPNEFPILSKFAKEILV